MPDDLSLVSRLPAADRGGVVHLRIGLRGTGAPLAENLSPHCPPELALLRALPDCDPEPPDRQPAAPRPLPRGGHLLAAVAWICAVWVALGTAAWVLHWMICN